MHFTDSQIAEYSRHSLTALCMWPYPKHRWKKHLRNICKTSWL